MDGSPFNVFQQAVSPGRRFSHGWVAKDGSSEQYTTLDMMSWAQASGNPWYWAFETEGKPGEPLTGPQIVTLARWHNFVGASDLIALRPGDHGIGTHYMGLAAWGAHSCPDPQGQEGKGPRSLQRTDILKAAVALRQSPPVTPVRVPPRVAPPTVPAFPGMMRLGSTGGGVRTLQRQLLHRGWAITVDGVYGQATLNTVEEFQRRKGLAVDGEVGPLTWRALWLAQ
jgi:peptidoglycan hydrolase-like protein with peptidoglycan-binding domain